MKKQNNKQKISSKNVVLALALATIIFIAGISLGNKLVEQKYSYLDSTVSDLRTQTLSLELQYDLLSEDPCRLQNSSFLVNELEDLGDRLTFLEGEYDKDAPEILSLKQQYSLLQIQHWLFYKKVREECNNSVDVVLYFYSNEDCRECEAQGEVLTAFKKKYAQSTNIYSFDIRLTDPASMTLRDKYGIIKTPSVVFNNVVFDSKVSFAQLEALKRS